MNLLEVYPGLRRFLQSDWLERLCLGPFGIARQGVLQVWLGLVRGFGVQGSVVFRGTRQSQKGSVVVGFRGWDSGIVVYSVFGT